MFCAEFSPQTYVKCITNTTQREYWIRDHENISFWCVNNAERAKFASVFYDVGFHARCSGEIMYGIELVLNITR